MIALKDLSIHYEFKNFSCSFFEVHLQKLSEIPFESPQADEAF